MREVQLTFQKLRNKKSPRQDGNPNDLLKYGVANLLQQLTELIREILHQQELSNEWQTSTITLKFKKRGKITISNKREIN